MTPEIRNAKSVLRCAQMRLQGAETLEEMFDALVMAERETRVLSALVDALPDGADGYVSDM